MLMKKSDFEWFIENYNNLYESYGDSYIAIKDNTVIGTYKNPREALRDVSLKYESGTYIIQKCNGCASAYTASIVTTGIQI